jgi:restriction system protein
MNLAYMTKKQMKQQEEGIQALLLLVAGASYLYTQSITTTGIIVGVVISLIIIYSITKAMKRRERLKKSGINEIDRMNGIQFEHYLKELFLSRGYKVHVTPAAGDYGADLILSKDREKIVVQAKRYSKNVGIKSVQEVAGAKTYYQATKAWVVTNSFYTKASKELASKLDVRLVDRESLITYILQMNPNALSKPERASK